MSIEQVVGLLVLRICCCGSDEPTIETEDDDDEDDGDDDDDEPIDVELVRLVAPNCCRLKLLGFDLAKLKSALLRRTAQLLLLLNVFIRPLLELLDDDDALLDRLFLLTLE
jgi:hypothetical protein